MRRRAGSTLVPYTTLFRSGCDHGRRGGGRRVAAQVLTRAAARAVRHRVRCLRGRRVLRHAPRRTRTPSLLIRSQALYPVELWALGWSTVNGLWYETHSGEQLSRNSPSCSLCPGTRCASVHLLLLTTLQPCMGGTRLELVTSTMSTWRSNQLS